MLAGEAAVVRQVFDSYTREHGSMGAIARSLTVQGIPTRTGKERWDRSTIWGMLHNPAYYGRACYGKTGTGSRQRVTRPLRKPGKFAGRQVGGLERPREEWIEIPVPALVSAEQFEQAQEQLEANKRHATRRRRNRLCSKACWCVVGAATPTIEPRHGRRSASCTTTAVWVRTDGATRRACVARVGRCDRTGWTRWFGGSWSGCWKSRH